MSDCPYIESLFCKEKFDSEPVIDVIFIHGLNGHGKETWMHNPTDEETYWPNWLFNDSKYCNVHSVYYKTPSGSLLKGAGVSISEMADQIIDMLHNEGLASKPKLFVAHSLGGILTKQILCNCHQSIQNHKKDILESFKGVIFLGTPHKGSKIANLSQIVTSIAKMDSEIVDGLGYSNKNLSDLDKWFRDYCVDKKLHISAYCEGNKTSGFEIVDRVSSDPSIGGVDPIVLSLNHRELSKPLDRKNPIYRNLYNFVKRHISQAFEDDDPIMKDYEYYTTRVPEDERLSLEEKLNLGDRSEEKEKALEAKQAFSMLINKNAAQVSSIKVFSHLLSDMVSRYRSHVNNLVEENAKKSEVSSTIHDKVIDPIYQNYKNNEFKPLTKRYIEGALYYLGGHCHIQWHKNTGDNDD